MTSEVTSESCEGLVVTVRHHSELIAWQKTVDLVVAVYVITAEFPKSESFGLTNQMRRASVSVPSNIAEGQGRGTTRDFTRFLHIARGSLHELETQVEIACRIGYISTQQFDSLRIAASEAGRVLNGLIRSLPTTDH